MVWLSSELLFFASLFAALFTLRANSPGPWPPPGADPDVALGAVLTVALLASSATQHRAADAARHGDRAGVRWWVAITAAIGAAFLAGQAWEWSQLGFGVSDHAFGSVFYTLTGFHGLHVLGGLLAFAVLLGRTADPTFLPTGRPAVETVTAYWHVVDAVWVAVFASLYLLR
jgi:cytochrome c oxidase subunit 3